MKKNTQTTKCSSQPIPKRKGIYSMWIGGKKSNTTEAAQKAADYTLNKQEEK